MDYKKVESYNYPSGMGGNFLVYLKSAHIAVIVYGKKDFYGWNSYGDFDGKEMIIDPERLSNKKIIEVPKNHGEFSVC